MDHFKNSVGFSGVDWAITIEDETTSADTSETLDIILESIGRPPK